MLFCNFYSFGGCIDFNYFGVEFGEVFGLFFGVIIYICYGVDFFESGVKNMLVFEY